MYCLLLLPLFLGILCLFFVFVLSTCDLLVFSMIFMGLTGIIAVF